MQIAPERQTDQANLIKALCNSELYPHPAQDLQLIETHISSVILAGEFAYKFKKPVNFGFLDFSTLEKRKFYCNEELRLNQRQAKSLYLAVVPITGSSTAPQLNGSGEIIDYAVKMRRFSQQDLLEHWLANGSLTREHIDQLAQALVEFHQTIARATDDDEFGTLKQVTKYTLENCQVIAPCLTESVDQTRLADYQRWIETQHQRLNSLFIARKQQGFIRECHGDLHLRNITLTEGKIGFFDCIEFNPALRWVDVVSELAFLAMDLEAAGHAEFSHRLINAYFELTGDYAGVPLLKYYLAYRAMVRAKVAFLRLPQAETALEQNELRKSASDYLHLAWRYATEKKLELIITHGFSGSGKSTHTLGMLEVSGAIRVRSDVERKRMHGLSALQALGAELNAGGYNPQATQQTYQRLAEITELLLAAELPVIVDATFLKQWQRDLFHSLAEKKNVAFKIIDFCVAHEELKRRVALRQAQAADASDASVAVLEQQIGSAEPLTAQEQRFVTRYPG